MTEQQATPGWYPVDDNKTVLRFWTGEAWHRAWKLPDGRMTKTPPEGCAKPDAAFVSSPHAVPPRHEPVRSVSSREYDGRLSKQDASRAHREVELLERQRTKPAPPRPWYLQWWGFGVLALLLVAVVIVDRYRFAMLFTVAVAAVVLGVWAKLTAGGGGSIYGRSSPFYVKSEPVPGPNWLTLRSVAGIAALLVVAFVVADGALPESALPESSRVSSAPQGNSVGMIESCAKSLHATGIADYHQSWSSQSRESALAHVYLQDSSGETFGECEIEVTLDTYRVLRAEYR